MKFTEEQIDFIHKILSEESVDIEIIVKIKEKLSEQKTKKTKKDETTVKNTATCIANTKAGKRCSKKPSKGEQMCSVHLKKPSDSASVKSVDSTPEVDNMSKEEKKRQIELIFEENE